VKDQAIEAVQAQLLCKRLMPAKINVTSHISLHMWSWSHEVLPKS